MTWGIREVTIVTNFVSTDLWKTRWWQLKHFLIFTPIPGEMIHFDQHIFQLAGSTTRARKIRTTATDFFHGFGDCRRVCLHETTKHIPSLNCLEFVGQLLSEHLGFPPKTSILTCHTVGHTNQNHVNLCCPP